MTPTEIRTIISTLTSQLASGSASLKFREREVRYSSVEEIKKAIEYFNGLLAEATSSTNDSRRQIRMYSGDGY